MPSLLCITFKFPAIIGKGAIVMIIWNLFFTMSLFTSRQYVIYTFDLVAIIMASLAVSYPLIGWLADTRLGKFNVLLTSSYLLAAAIILKSVGTFITPERSILYLSLIVSSVAVACWLSSIIPFITDQVVGASAEELSFAVLWLLWSSATGYCVATLTSLFSEEHRKYCQFCLSLISFVVALIWLESCHCSLMTQPVISNPIKLIIQVLNYARKHKYPERRSALTYWEEDYPTSLDIGKDKYGGPFTFEQVEDVKTVLRLILLVTCTSIFQLEFWNRNPLIVHHSNCNLSYMYFFRFASTYPQFYPCAFAFIGFPVYYFIIFPVFRKYVLTIIRRIGLGLLLMALSHPLSAIVELVEVTLSQTLADDVCISDGAVSTAAGCPTSYQLLNMILSELVQSVGAMIALWGLIELIIAQTPHEIIGFMLTLSTTIAAVFIVMSLALDHLLKKFSLHFFPSCLFYYQTIYAVIGVLAFVLYVLVARWYKLRIRDDIVPYHTIAEEFFEKEVAQRRAFIQEYMLEDDEESSDNYSTSS